MIGWNDVQYAVLLSSHRYGDGVMWSFVAGGMLQSDETSPRVNTPDLITQAFDTYGDALRGTARDVIVPIEFLVSAIALTAELVGTDAAATSVRFLDGFNSWETTPELALVGCTGIRFDLAQSLVGATSADAFLADPQTAITAAALHILGTTDETRYQPPIVASVYNLGSLRYDQTSRWRMANGDQIDRFIGWFNTTVSAVSQDPTLATDTPSFTAALATILAPSAPTSSVQTSQMIKPESRAAIDAGMMTLCVSNPSLSTIWSLDDTTTSQIGNVAKDAAAGLGLPLGLDSFTYPDRGGTMRTMNSTEVQSLYRAMRDYIAAISYYDVGRAPSLPGQPVPI